MQNNCRYGCIVSERFKCVMPRILFLHPNFCTVNALEHSHMIFIKYTVKNGVPHYTPGALQHTGY